ncbi:MAG TPA: AI-2E family transporter [Thermoanaerobaculia bacterium]|jgi:predicted PurR-regulated permease PerM
MNTNAQALPASRRPPSDFERYAVLALLLLLLFSCYLIVRPFLIAFLWGWIIAISTRGLYNKCVSLLRGRRKVAAALTTLLLVAILLVPVALLGANVADGVPRLIEWFNGMLAGGLKEPPSWLAGIPLVGKRATEWWTTTAADPEKLRQQLRPYFGPIKDFLLAAAASIGIGVLQFALALFLAAMLYVQGDSFAAVIDNIATRLAGDFGHRQVAVVRSTVRSVFRGMIGTAAAQAILAIIGFWIAGIPNVLLLGMATFFLSIIPGGPTLLWLPAAIWLGANGSTGRAIFLAIWGLFIIGGSDNIIRPLLIGKGTEAPMAIIFLGVIGGIVAFGFLGLFIGPVVLTVAYNLFREWIQSFAPKPAPIADAPP